MTAPVADALPYGIRDGKLTPYTDAQGTVLDTESIDLPNMQKLSFSESEEFAELRGDDRLITTRGKGAQVDWSLEAGGISVKAWAIMSGGSVIESGLTPNRKIILRKKATDTRPFFRIDGRIVSDSGGDVHVRIYRCRCNDTIQGDFADGEFFVTSASGVGLPLLDDQNDLLYDIIRHESNVVLTLTPEANPIPVPMNLSFGTVATTTAALTWTAVTAADSYLVQQSTNGTTWTAVTSGHGGEPTAATTTVTTLTTATLYYFRVAAVIDSVTGEYSAAISTTTA
jgi:hypothetical protein